MDRSAPKSPRFAAALPAGILLIFFGLIFLLDLLKLLDSRAVWHQWPLILLGAGLLHLWRTTWLDLGGHGMVATAAAFELAHLSGHGFRQLWPLILIWLGGVFVLRAVRARQAA